MRLYLNRSEYRRSFSEVMSGGGRHRDVLVYYDHIANVLNIPKTFILYHSVDTL